MSNFEGNIHENSVLRVLADGPKRYVELLRFLVPKEMSRGTLSRALSALEASGKIRRDVYRTKPPGTLYSLKQRGTKVEKLGKPRSMLESDRSARRSIAILPLQNLSKNRKSEVFADGLTEELISAFGNVSQLDVMARTSVVKFKGEQMPPSKVCKQLKVSYVLEGSVRSGERHRIRILVRLIDSRDRVLWVGTYDRELENMLDIQVDIGQKVVETLNVKVAPDEQRRIVRRSAQNYDAYYSYLNGLYAERDRTKKGLLRGMKFFKEAIKADPNYPLAYVGLADCYMLASGDWGLKSGHRKAKDLITRALQLDDSLGEAHASLAFILVDEWDWKGAEREYKKAITLNESYAQARHWFATYLALMGRSDEAISQIERALELDPFSMMVGAAAGMVYIYSGKYDEAIGKLQRVLRDKPDFVPALWNLASAYLLKSKTLHEDAIILAEKSSKLGGDKSYYRCALGYANAVVGRTSEAKEILRELREKQAPAFFIGFVYAGLGDSEETLNWLWRAYDEHSDHLVLLKASPMFAPYRSHPRFVELLTRTGLS